ncbi:MAG: anthranilate synthase component I, partial [Candidatus Puniceispirillaceae bacterium]
MADDDDFDRFADGFAAGTPQLVARELVADTQTPVSAYLRLAAGRRNTFLLESVEGGEIRGRFSIIGLTPDLIWRSRGTTAEINRAPQDGDSFVAEDQPPIESLRALMAESAMTDTGTLPPMAAGLFGYFGYDMIRHIEDIPDSNPVAIDTPDSMLVRPSLIAIFDRLRDSITLVVQVRPSEWDEPAAAWNVAQSRIANALKALDAPMPATEAGGSQAVLPQPQSNVAKKDFLSMVDRAKDYIRAGDIFQVVLSQ